MVVVFGWLLILLITPLVVAVVWWRSWKRGEVIRRIRSAHPALVRDAAVFEVLHRVGPRDAPGEASRGILCVQADRASLVRARDGSVATLDIPASGLGDVGRVPGVPWASAVWVDDQDRRHWITPDVDRSFMAHRIWDIWIVLAELRGTPKLLLEVPSKATGLIAHAPLLAFAMTVVLGIAGWAMSGLLPRAVPVELLVVVGVILMFVAPFAGGVLRATRNARVFFYEDRVIIASARRVAVRRWEELEGFKDSSVDHVRFVKKGAIPEPDLIVPTPNERTRVLVLKTLDGRGVQRIE